MPRIYASNGDAVDFCNHCFPNPIGAEGMFMTKGREGSFSYDAAHPPYDENEYGCHRCGRLLTAADDFIN